MGLDSVCQPWKYFPQTGRMKGSTLDNDEIIVANKTGLKNIYIRKGRITEIGNRSVIAGGWGGGGFAYTLGGDSLGDGLALCFGVVVVTGIYAGVMTHRTLFPQK